MTFVIRVLLHGARLWEQYEQLHSAMEAEGFSRTIDSTDGKTYDLPPAEYLIDTDDPINEVLARAKSAAATTNLQFSLLASEASQVYFVGLTEHKPKPDADAVIKAALRIMREKQQSRRG